jgi:hypothetical protein
MALVVAGSVVLGSGSPSLQTAAKAGAHPSDAHVSEGQLSPGQMLAMASLPSANQGAAGAVPGPYSQARNIYAGLPLMFEPNQGQANLDPSDPRSKFVARGSGYSLFLGSEGAILQLSSGNSSKRDSSKHGDSGSAARVEFLQMRLAGANPNPRLIGTNLLPGKSNYLLGNDPAKWRRGIPQFARVRYEEVYPGINLIFYGNQGHLEYDFQVAPGSDPAQAELEFDGAKQLELKDGALLIRGENGSVCLEAPRVYQEIAGREQLVEGSFVLRGANRAGFTIGAYDHARELVIDPVLAFSTYFGGSLDEQASSVAVDSSNNIYLTGSTDSVDLPVTLGVFQGTFHTTSPSTNVYIAKITPPLGVSPSLDYVTYLGGTGSDSPVGIGVDDSGDAYVAGTTSSADFPTTPTGYQQTPESSGNKHVFVTELDPLAATLRYSSYLSGSGTDIASGMTVDEQGYIYVTGTTTSVETLTTDQFPATNLPQPLPFQSIPRYSTQFFVTKVNTSAPKNGSIAYSTYFGGGAFEGTTLYATGGGITVDTNGNIYFTGTTNFTYTGCAGCSTTDFPILDAYQPCLDQPPPSVIINPPTCTNSAATSVNPDAFVAKLANPSIPQNAQAGAALLLWSTYLGGSQSDSGTGIALDTGAANVYVTGTTNSQDFVASSTINTLASYQKCLNNLPPTTTTGSVSCTVQTNPAPNDAFVARLSNPTASGTTTQPNVSLTYFSYLGGSANEAGLAITVDAASGALLTGWTESTDFPVFPNPNTIQSSLNPTRDAFIARLNTNATVTGQTTTASWANYFGGHGIGEGTGITHDTNQTIYLAGDTNATDLAVREPLPVNEGGGYHGGYDAFVTQFGTASSLSISGVLTLGTNQTYISAGNQATFTYTLTNGGPDLAYNINVTDNLQNSPGGVTLTLNSASATSGTCTPPGSSSTSATCTIPSLQAASTATITIVVTPSPNASGNQAQFNGGTVIANAPNAIAPAQTSVPAQMSDYSVSASPANVTVVAGNTATYQVQLTPHPVYGSGITLSVSGLPTGAANTFTTGSVTLQGTSPATTTLNISTTARPITTPTASLWTRPFYAIWIAFPGLALLGMEGDRRRRRIAGVLLLGLISTLLLLQPACTHQTTQPPISGTPAGTYSLTIAATSGSDTKNYPITLNVQ